MISRADLRKYGDEVDKSTNFCTVNLLILMNIFMLGSTSNAVL